MKIAFLNETSKTENRVACIPEVAGRLLGKHKGLTLMMAKGAGTRAGFSDADYKKAGVKISTAAELAKADILLRVTPLNTKEADTLKKGQTVIGFLDPATNGKQFEKLAKKGINLLAVEKTPRTSRAQSMDALSSQAGIAGYRAVLEASLHFNKFFPLMMTSAGSSKPAKVVILGVGVAGLQAIATAKRLGAQVSAFDIRPEVKEQIESLGGKYIELDIGEEGKSEGGYAKALSKEAQAKQQAALQEVLKKADVVITTAQIPGRAAPVLVTEATVKGMREGSVIIDMAAGGFNLANKVKGGNCPLTEADKVTVKHGVILVGHTNYPAMVAADASNFYARNLMNLLALLLKEEKGKTTLNFDFEDDIVDGVTATHNGEVR